MADYDKWPTTTAEMAERIALVMQNDRPMYDSFRALLNGSGVTPFINLK